MPTKRKSMLRGYTWDAALGRYRDAAGRFVARTRVLALLERSVNGRTARMIAGVQAVADGRISARVGAMRTALLLKRQYLQSAALGAGGWDRLTAADYGRVGGLLRAEYRRMAAMLQQLAKGEISVAQALNRLNMYQGNARREFFHQERRTLPPPPPGKTRLERRYLGNADHCDDCVRYADMGWQMEGILPLPSEGSDCDGNCRCTLARKLVDVEAARLIFGPQAEAMA
jgi:hypothetical protein